MRPPPKIVVFRATGEQRLSEGRLLLARQASGAGLELGGTQARKAFLEVHRQVLSNGGHLQVVGLRHFPYRLAQRKRPYRPKFAAHPFGRVAVKRFLPNGFFKAGCRERLTNIVGAKSSPSQNYSTSAERE